MANQEQLEILKEGVDVWNRWRQENPNIKVDLRDANLWKANLRKVNLSEAILFDIDFREVDLRKADLSRAKLNNAKLNEAKLERANLGEAVLNKANLYCADLNRANLFGAKLIETDLNGTNLREAKLNKAILIDAVLIDATLQGANLNKVNLTSANLSQADLSQVNLDGATLTNAIVSEANLQEADLTGADLGNTNMYNANLEYADLSKSNLTNANLGQANFTFSKLGYTIFGSNNLSDVIGLTTVEHYGPSVVGIETIQVSRGKISIEFLIGCGLSDVDIEYAKLYNPDLNNEEINGILYNIYDLRAQQPIQISPLFISYSHADSAFIDRVEEHLAEIGIRFWRDIHDMKAGRIEKQIDRAIRHNPTVLLVLSSNSIQSDWVEHEVRAARELEKELGRDTLCPVALDDSWKDSPWPKRVMEQVMEYNILDFSEWEDDVKFEGMFHRLIDGLELFYKG